MNVIFGKFGQKISRLISFELRNFRFLLGQSAVLSSRAHSENFKSLWDAEVKVYSQFGEDGILDYLCQRLGLSKPKILEVGVGNFSECNSRFLAENRNASVFAVDSREDLISSVERNPLQSKNHIFALQAWVVPENINNIIAQARTSMSGIDIFSLDLDGIDYWILNEANLDAVSIVVVEYNPLFGSLKAVSVPRDDNFDRRTEHYSWLFYGASLKAFEHLLKKKNFQFIGTNRVGNNAFFVRQELTDLIPIVPERDYSVYTDWRVRESRSEDGNLSLESGYQRVKKICNLRLIDVITGESISVGAANPIQE